MKPEPRKRVKFLSGLVFKRATGYFWELNFLPKVGAPACIYSGPQPSASAERAEAALRSEAANFGVKIPANYPLVFSH